jgi:hypothetical protein
METKLFVAAKYLDHKEMGGGLRPNLSRIAAKCRVGWDFVAKIELELVENDRVLTPKEFTWLGIIRLGRDRGACLGRIFLCYTCSIVSVQRGRLRAMSIGCFAARGQLCRKVRCLDGSTSLFQ